MNNIYLNDFDKHSVFDKIDNIDMQLQEEQMKEPDKRDRDREFELLYAKMIAGLKLNTGYKLF